MANLRKWLTDNQFDWKNGKIIYQRPAIPFDDSEYTSICPGWISWEEVEEVLEIGRQHPILNMEFDNGFGGPECPRIIAEDGEKIYFPVQYDGSTWLGYVYKDIDYYKEHLSPYFGAS